MTCFKMIKARQGKIKNEEIDAKLESWFKDVKGGNHSLAQVAFFVKEWTCERYGIKGDEQMLDDTFKKVDKEKQVALTRDDVGALLREANWVKI